MNNDNKRQAALSLIGLETSHLPDPHLNAVARLYFQRATIWDEETAWQYLCDLIHFHYERQLRPGSVDYDHTKRKISLTLTHLKYTILAPYEKISIWREHFTIELTKEGKRYMGKREQAGYPRVLKWEQALDFFTQLMEDINQ